MSAARTVHCADAVCVGDREARTYGDTPERVRVALGVPRERVLAVADGRNDIELLTWAAERGLGEALATL
jgi:hypothetical protein